MEPVKEKNVDQLSIESPEEYIAFLGEVFQATSDSDGNAQVVYPILFANQDKLNYILVGVYQDWANYIFSQLIPEAAPQYAKIFVNLSDLMWQFPLGNRASNLDVAIIGYKLALTIFTRADFPEKWATTQNNLGLAYSHKITDNSAENFYSAISCLKLALEVYTRDDFPEKWAATQNNLGNAYSHKLTDNQVQNLDRAINCYQEALEVYTRDDFPEKWAMIQNNLGLAYSDKMTGNLAQNIDRAIDYYQEALTIFTRADFPEKWAMTQNNLGLAYSDKIIGDETKNINEAIACSKRALEVYTRADFPEDWARAQNNLGIAYFAKITGDETKNINAAIAYSKRALEVYTRADFPEDWARVQNNLGLAYFAKITRYPYENINAAIACYKQALEVYTRADFPEKWAATQHSLGCAYSNKSGSRAKNINTAIACYKQALEVYTRVDFPEKWARTQNNLGFAYYKINGNGAENIDIAITSYKKALEVYTRNDFPEKWAMTQNNLGLAYNNKITGNRAENIDAAITCYQKALEVYTRKDFHRNWAMIQNNLVTAYKEKITGNQDENIDTNIKILDCQPEYYLSQCAEETGLNETELNLWIQAIHRKSQAILQGPPGTGKTFIAEKLAKHLIGGGDGFSDIIQFHPAYTYEDFIEGLRPITQNGQLTYSIVPGRFLEFCKKAEVCEDTCVLIIDEINRANLSQVFGELMYLLDDRQNTQRFITLASGQLFKIPTNVRIIGTMNTADRSIALVDNALRRRFAFIPLSPNYKVLRHYHKTWQTGFPIARLNLLIGILKKINVAINNKHYQLGISFFLTKTLAEDIQDIWQMEIEPYLEEYFFDNQAKMDEFIWDKIKDKFSKR